MTAFNQASASERNDFPAAVHRLNAAIEVNPELGELEKLAAKSLGLTILQGDMEGLKKFMNGYRDNPNPLSRIAHGLARALNNQDINVTYSPIVDWFKTEAGQSIAVAAISIHLLPLHRMICVATHERHQDFVYEMTGTGRFRQPVMVNEDAEMVMKKIGLASCRPASVGPPMSAPPAQVTY